MQYRIDKRSGNKLSVLGFGCMRFPKTLGMIDMRKTEELVMTAIAGGVNYFDTAWIYPGSEEALGTIFEKNKVRDKVYIATKLPVVVVKGPEDFDKYFSKSLERLRTDHIDYYLLHMLTDTDQWQRLKAWGIEDWIAEKKKIGQIRQIGFSYHGKQDDFLKIVGDYPWEFCQIQYNYSDENFQAGVTGLRKAAETMPVVIMEPLLGGRLADALPKDAVSIFKKAKADLSPAGWGLNWVWNQEEVGLLLSGMSNMAQLEENLRLADKARPGMLGEGEKDVYRRALEVINRAYRIRCTGCNYCMPCPKGVNIPGCFAAYNTSFSIGFGAGLQQFVTSIGVTSEKTGSPGHCIKCGKCEAHCPQHLPIIKDLEIVRKKMEPFWFRAGIALARKFLGRGRGEQTGA
ncbi:aldo/keto reductase [Spirochaetia bacterium]|nr:aldo/keto reductase [Spirochaetia bacterium]